MKLVVKKIQRHGKDLILTTELSEYYMHKLVTELNDDRYDVTIKKHKESRSTRQNDMLWGLINRISDEVNGSHRESDIMNIYQDLLKRANVKYVILAAVREAKPTLEQTFRYVMELPNSMTTEKGVELVAFKCYIGSSRYDTKEMTELIDTALDYANEIGIDDVETLRGEL